MAVVVDAFDVVIRADAIADVAAFARTVPNKTFCTDGSLLRVSFMVERDRAAFVATLTVPATAVASVDREPLGTQAEWLETRHYAGVSAAWMRGASPEPLVVPLGWKPHAMTLHTKEYVAENFEFLGVENSVEVYRDKRTGKKHYAGRTQPAMDPAKATKLDALYKEATTLVQPFILGKKDLGFFEKRRLKKGIGLLERLLEEAPDHWSSMWILAMGLRALGEHESALKWFRSAYELVPGQPDVGREYAGQCFILGKADDGVRISRELHARFRDDIGLHSDLALALLIGGDLDEALSVATAAHERDRSDTVTKSLVGYIKAVKSGAKPRPTKLPGY